MLRPIWTYGLYNGTHVPKITLETCTVFNLGSLKRGHFHLISDENKGSLTLAMGKCLWFSVK